MRQKPGRPDAAELTSPSSHHSQSMKDNTQKIARQLIEENGLQEARRLVLAAVLDAQEQGDFYRLSVWREIRRILAEKPNEAGGGG